MRKESASVLVKRLRRQRLRKVKLEMQLKETQRRLLSRMMEKEEIRIPWENNKECIVKKKTSQIREFSPRILLEVAGEEAFGVLYARAGKVDEMLLTMPHDKRELIISSVTYRNTMPYIRLFFVKNKTKSQEAEEQPVASSVEPVLAK